MKISSISKQLKQCGFKPLKRLGQNFLIDENVLRKIIEAADLPASPSGGSPEDVVLEIGPGLGILTLELAKKVKKVIAVEKDERMCEILKNILNDKNIKNVEVINQDILKTDPQLYLDREKVTDYKIVANIPYYLTSPLIRRFLETGYKPNLMVLMVQKEVAQRIIAKPPHMNLLATSVQFYAEPKIISYVSKKSFWPIPKVDSAIIKIIPRKSALLSAPICDKFFELVRAGFSSKRKMLINNLSRKFKIEKEKLKNLLEEININPRVRAENLSLDDWLRVIHIL